MIRCRPTPRRRRGRSRPLRAASRTDDRADARRRPGNGAAVPGVPPQEPQPPARRRCRRATPQWPAPRRGPAAAPGYPQLATGRAGVPPGLAAPHIPDAPAPAGLSAALPPGLPAARLPARAIRQLPAGRAGAELAARACRSRVVPYVLRPIPRPHGFAWPRSGCGSCARVIDIVAVLLLNVRAQRLAGLPVVAGDVRLLASARRCMRPASTVTCPTHVVATARLLLTVIILLLAIAHLARLRGAVHRDERPDAGQAASWASAWSPLEGAPARRTAGRSGAGRRSACRCCSGCQPDRLPDRPDPSAHRLPVADAQPPAAPGAARSFGADDRGRGHQAGRHRAPRSGDDTPPRSARPRHTPTEEHDEPADPTGPGPAADLRGRAGRCRARSSWPATRCRTVRCPASSRRSPRPPRTVAPLPRHGRRRAPRRDSAERYGVDPERVATGCGSVAMAEHLARATCVTGDEIVYSWRSFEAYPIIAATTGATSVRVPNTAAHGHDLDAMVAAITDRTRMILVCNPNNPTGTASAPRRTRRVPRCRAGERAGRAGRGLPRVRHRPGRAGRHRRPTRTVRTWSCCGRSRRPGAWPGCGSVSSSARPRSPPRSAR